MRRRRRRGLGNATACRIPADLLSGERCATEKGKTFCVGDRVRRSDVKGPGVGTVLVVHPGGDNQGRKKMAARVCWDGSEANELAYPYLFAELKKANK